MTLSQNYLAIKQPVLSPTGVCAEFTRMSAKFAEIADLARPILTSDDLSDVEALNRTLTEVMYLQLALDIYPARQLLCTVIERVLNEWIERAKLDHDSLKSAAFTDLQTSLLMCLNNPSPKLFNGKTDVYLITFTDKMVEIANRTKSESLLMSAATIRCKGDFILAEIFADHCKRW
jgi:hypothetical protein